MGLDMYLEKRTYLGNKWKKAEEQAQVSHPGIKQERVQSITEEVGYWRKANQIHKWFVDNVQEGVDDCKEYWVSQEKLKLLLDTVNKCLKKKSKATAMKLFPPQSGFFFGSYEIDEFYWQDLENTKKILEDLFAENGLNDGSYYYNSSW